MSLEAAPSPPVDWTAAVESAVGQEFERRRRWVRVYLLLVGAAVLATLAMVAYAGWSQPERIAEEVGAQVSTRVQQQMDLRVIPLKATDARLQGQDVALARNQLDLTDRIAALEQGVAALQRDQARTERRLRQLERAAATAGAASANAAAAQR